jgi:hypothetical protein
MVQTPTNDQDRLIDQSLSLLRNAIAETKTVLPAVEFRRVEEPKDVVPETPFQQEQTASLIDQTLSLLRNAIAETKTVLPTVEFRGAEKPKDVVPETPFQQEQTAFLIGQPLSLVEESSALEPKEPETPSNMQQSIAEQTSTDVLPAEPPVQQEQTASLIDQALSLVEDVAAREPNEPETPSNMQQPIAKQTSTDVLPAEPQEQNASLIDQTLWAAKNVTVPKTNPVEVAPHSPQQPLAKELTSKERLDMQRAEIQKRVATFKANQQRFQQEREKYYAMTLAKIATHSVIQGVK